MYRVEVLVQGLLRVIVVRRWRLELWQSKSVGRLGEGIRLTCWHARVDDSNASQAGVCVVTRPRKFLLFVKLLLEVHQLLAHGVLCPIVLAKEMLFLVVDRAWEVLVLLAEDLVNVNFFHIFTRDTERE